MVKIAVLSPNNCNFDTESLSNLILPLVYTSLSKTDTKRLIGKLNAYIEDVISPYIEFAEIDRGDDCDFMENICKHFMPDSTDNIATGDLSFSTKHGYVDIYHAKPNIPIKYKDDSTFCPDFNSIASICSIGHIIIHNKCVMLAYGYTSNGDLEMTNISMKDIVRIIRRRYINTAVCITPNKIQKYYYQNKDYLIRSIFNCSETDINLIETHSFTLYGFNLIFRYGVSDIPNKICTRLANKPINGTCIIFSTINGKNNDNISIAEIEKIDAISYGPLVNRDRNLTGNIDESDKTKNCYELYHKYSNLIKLFAVREKKCDCCDKIFPSLSLCSKCYRARYCGVECQKSHYSKHKFECLRDHDNDS